LSTNSFYFGRICTTKTEFNTLIIGQKLVLQGKSNFLGFFTHSYKIEKPILKDLSDGLKIPLEMGSSIIKFDNQLKDPFIFNEHNK